MSKVLYGFVCLTLLVAHSFGQGFHSVHSPNGVDVWAVGNGGTIFHSFDGGVTWTTRTQGTAPLRGVFVRGSAVWTVGDNGNCFQSTNSGDTWAPKSLSVSVALRSVTFTGAATGWIAGDNGTILKTTDGGETWNTQASGTSQRLNKTLAASPTNAFVVGAGGTFLRTIDGGTTWTPVSVNGSTKEFFSVGASGTSVYIAGADALAYKSEDSGQTWTTLDFRIDSKSDINGVYVKEPQLAVFVGGGGFIRSTVERSTDYTFGLHQMHAKLNDVFFYDGLKGWACSEKNNAVLRTTDGGVTWLLPQGTSVSYSWSSRISTSSSIGNTFVLDPWNKNRIFEAASNVIYMSADRGDTWASVPGKTAGGGSQWSFYISPRDSNIWLTATSGSPKGVKRSTDRGVTWTSVLARNFTNYGMPLEMDPDHPDTVLFAEDQGVSGIAPVYRSTNFGATWDTLGLGRFRSPCDVYIVPDTTGLIYLADGITGNGNAQMWRSTNGGVNWTSIYSSASSEIPMIAVSRLRKTQGFATHWGGGGAVMRTTNAGISWTSVATTGSTWGADIAKDDPNVFMYGTYGGGTSYLSTNSGGVFTSSPLSGSNSGMLFYDRATVLAHQAGGGINKYVVTYTVPVTSVQALTVTAPNGGEVWNQGSIQNITWTTTNISNLKIEFRAAPGQAWQTIVASTPAFGGSYAWLVPNIPTSQARIKISDAFDSAPIDSSDADFTVSGALAVEEQVTPISFALEQNYPNPFNPSTKISFALPKDEFVMLKVYNMLGQEVATLVNEKKAVGRYTVEFSAGTHEAAALSSGLYVYKLIAGEFVQTRKMLLLK